VTVRDLQQQLAAARQQAEDARAAVAKSEADLEDLSGAYNTLEAHAFKLEGQLRLQQTGACCPCSTAWTETCHPSASHPDLCCHTHNCNHESNGTCRSDIQSLLTCAAASGDTPPPAATEADIQRRIDAAVEEAQEESSESMNDLLVCLGQEEAKVGRCGGSLALAKTPTQYEHEIGLPVGPATPRVQATAPSRASLRYCGWAGLC